MTDIVLRVTGNTVKLEANREISVTVVCEGLKGDHPDSFVDTWDGEGLGPTAFMMPEDSLLLDIANTKVLPRD
jgi:hypothetical protein